MHNAKQGVGVVEFCKLVLAALGPAQAHLHAFGGLGLGGQLAVGFVRRAFVQLHHDVAVQGGLNLHAHLGRHEQLVAIHRRGEMHTLFGDFAHRTQAPHLKPATVGEDGFVPFFKLVQAAKALHDVQPRAHPQMKGVAQNDLRTHLVQAARHHALDCAVSAHRHEDRRLHHAVVEGQAATAGQALGFDQVEYQHGGSLSGAGQSPGFA